MRPVCLALVLAPLACSSSRPTMTIGPVFDATRPADVATDNVPETGLFFDASADVSDAGTDDATTSTEAGHDSGSKEAGDSGKDAVGSQVVPGLCPGGTGTLALVGGSSSSAFGAVSTNGAVFTVTSFAGPSTSAAPALLALGAGAFVGVFPSGAGDVIESTTYSTSAGWSSPAPIAAVAGKDAAATESAAPSLALLGANAELVYYGTNSFFYHGVYSGGAWGAASDAVGGSASQDFGPSQPTAAAAGTTLSVAFDGSNNGLYVDTWTVAGGWAGAQPIHGAGVGEVPPTLVALSGTDDFMLVYEQQTTNFLYAVLHANGGGWGTPVPLGATALATSQVSVAPLANGGAVMVYEGTNGLPYAAIYSPTTAPAWTVPVALVSNSGMVSSPPQVATGVCGFDAVAAVVQETGVEIVGLSAGVWSSPVPISSLSAMTFAAIATTQ